MIYGLLPLKIPETIVVYVREKEGEGVDVESKVLVVRWW
jgi:hypothetical protein